MDDAESLKTQVQAVFKRAQSSVGSHPACIKELGVLLEDYELEFVAVFQDAVIALLLNKQLKSEGATRVRDMMAKFVAAPDRDSKSKQWRDCLTSLIQRCIRTIRAATRVQDNDIRHCATSMLATIVTLSARWMGDAVHADLIEILMNRVQDKILGTRVAASEGIHGMMPFLKEERAETLAGRLRLMIAEDPRDEVRAAALKCLPVNAESSKVMLERTADRATEVRTAALEGLLTAPWESLPTESIHLLTANAYSAAKSFSQQNGRIKSTDEPSPMPKEKKSGDLAFSPAARQRREETALFKLLSRLLKDSENDMWQFLIAFPVEENHQATFFLLKLLFMSGVPFPVGFTTREPETDTDIVMSLAMAAAYCDSQPNTAEGREKVEELVPEAAVLADELLATAPGSASQYYLLKLVRFADLADEGGRSRLEGALVEQFANRPPKHIVQMLLSNMITVQPVVQKYVDVFAQLILGEWLDLTNPNWAELLQITSDILGPLPRSTQEFPALTRFHDDLIMPAFTDLSRKLSGGVKKMRESLDGESADELWVDFIKCVGLLGMHVQKTREEFYDQLCFWVTNQKKSLAIRRATMVVLVDWLSLPNSGAALANPVTGSQGNAQRQGQNQMDVDHNPLSKDDPTSPHKDTASKALLSDHHLDAEELARHLIQTVSATGVPPALAFAAFACLTRLCFSGLIKEAETLANFLQFALMGVQSDSHLLTHSSYFLPLWASYPEARPFICDGFLHLLQYHKTDSSMTLRRAAYKYVLRLLFEHVSDTSELGKYNFLVAKKCLKICYHDGREDVVEVLKELDFVGIPESDKTHLERMLEKLVNHRSSYKNLLSKISDLLTNPAERKKRTSVKFPELVAKTPKPAGRSSLGAEPLAPKPKLSGKRSHDDITPKEDAKKPAKGKAAPKTPSKGAPSPPPSDLNDESTDSEDANINRRDDTSEDEAARQDKNRKIDAPGPEKADSVLSKLEARYKTLGSYNAPIVIADTPKPNRPRRATSSKAAPIEQETPKTRSKPIQSKAAVTEPRPKRRKLEEFTGDIDAELEDAEEFIQATRFPKPLDSSSPPASSQTSIAATRSRRNTSSQNPPEESRPPRATAAAAKKRMARDSTSSDSDSDALELLETKTNTKAQKSAPPKPGKKSTAKKTRVTSSSDEYDSDVESSFSDEEDAKPKKKSAKRNKKDEIDDDYIDALVSDAPLPAQQPNEDEDDEQEPTVRRSKRARSSLARITTSPINLSYDSEEEKSAPAKKKQKKAEELKTKAKSSDWKKMTELPALSPPKGEMKIGFSGFASQIDQVKLFIEELDQLGVMAVDLASNPDAQVSHVVLNNYVPSRSTCVNGIRGVWMMNVKWIRESLKNGDMLPEDGYGARINKQLFHHSAIFFSPALLKDSKLRRLASAMVQEASGDVVTDPKSADMVGCLDEDNLTELSADHPNLSLVSFTTLLNDIHAAPSL